MKAPKQEELENEVDAGSTSAPPSLRASAVPQDSRPAKWPDLAVPPRDAGIDRIRPSSTRLPIEGEAAALPPNPDLFGPDPDLFAGDAAVIEMRRRLAIDPYYLPEAPFPAQEGALIRPAAVMKFALYLGAILALVVGGGVIEAMHSGAQRPVASNPNAAAVSANKPEVTTGSSGGSGAKPVIST